VSEGSPSDAARPEGRWSRLRWAGILMVLVSLFLPVHGCRAMVADFEPRPPGQEDSTWTISSPLLVPVEAIPRDWSRGWEADGLSGALREARQWYPYALVPLWIAALAALAGGGEAARRRIGLAAVALSVLLAVFEASYLWGTLGRGFDSWGPTWTRPLQVAGVWGVVLLVLLHRRPGRRRIEDAEATLSSQALLAALHGLSFPGWDFLGPVLRGHGAWPAAAAVSCNYRYGIWVAILGFLLVARPGYFSGRPAGGGYDPAFPWPSRSSTRTRTPTSTGSTGTGTRSTTAPAPPGSSPS